MHEWALAEGVVSTVDKMAEEEGLMKILEVTLKIGELQQVDYEILKFALEQLRTSKTAGAKFILETVPATLRCRVCGEKWKFNSEEISKEKTEAIHFLPEMAHIYLQCPKCQSPDFEITEGRGIWLGKVKGMKEDA
jgi:hydrogenase nickel incorporation protein HypA/HybF